MSRVAVLFFEPGGARAVVVDRRFGRPRFRALLGPAPAAEVAAAAAAAEVRLALPGPVARRVLLLSGRPSRETIAFEVEPDLPWPVEDAAVGSVALRGGRYAVSAGRREEADSALAPFREAGARAAAIDLEAAAAAGAARLARRKTAAVRFGDFAAIVERGVTAAVRPAPGMTDDEAFAAAAASAECEIPEARIIVGEGGLDARALMGAPADVPLIPLLAAAAPADSFPALAEAERPRRARTVVVLAAGAVVLTLAAGGVHAWAAARRADAAKGEVLSIYRRALPRGRGAAPRLELERAVAAAEARRDLLEGIVGKRDSAARALARLSAASPAGAALRLIEFRAEEGAFTLVAEASASADAAAFEKAAAAAEGLRDVRTPEVRSAPGGRGVRFTLEGRYE